jgi:hypothetical protein
MEKENWKMEDAPRGLLRNMAGNFCAGNLI